MNFYLATDSRRRKPRAWAVLALAVALGLATGCKSSSDEEKPGKTVLKTQTGETGIQVTETDEGGTQVIRVTTTFRGKKSTVVLAVDQPSYEIEIPLSIAQQQPAFAPGAAGPASAPGAPVQGGFPPQGGQFQDLLIAQYLERAQSAMIDGNYSESLRQVNLVLLVRPDHVQAHSMKGSIYYAMGNFQLANEEWEQVLTMDPSNEEVRGFMDFLKDRQGVPRPALPGSLPGEGPPPPRSSPPTGPTGARQ